MRTLKRPRSKRMVIPRSSSTRAAIAAASLAGELVCEGHGSVEHDERRDLEEDDDLLVDLVHDVADDRRPPSAIAEGHVTDGIAGIDAIGGGHGQHAKTQIGALGSPLRSRLEVGSSLAVQQDETRVTWSLALIDHPSSRRTSRSDPPSVPPAAIESHPIEQDERRFRLRAPNDRLRVPAHEARHAPQVPPACGGRGTCGRRRAGSRASRRASGTYQRSQPARIARYCSSMSSPYIGKPSSKPPISSSIARRSEQAGAEHPVALDRLVRHVGEVVPGLRGLDVPHAGGAAACAARACRRSSGSGGASAAARRRSRAGAARRRRSARVPSANDDEPRHRAGLETHVGVEDEDVGLARGGDQRVLVLREARRLVRR